MWDLVTSSDSVPPTITNTLYDEAEKDNVDASFQQIKHDKQVKYDNGSLELNDEWLKSSSQVLKRLRMSTKWNRIAQKTHYSSFSKRAGKGGRVVRSSSLGGISSIINALATVQRHFLQLRRSWVDGWKACWRSSGLSELEFLTQSRCSSTG